MPTTNHCPNGTHKTQGVKQHTHNGHPVTSEFVGVSFDERLGCWRMDISITLDGVRHRYHSYHEGPDGELDAALAYNQKAKELYGESARLN
jgi:hypothetical protein